MYSKHYILLMGLLCSFLLFPQQEARFTQYMFNTININPAYAGSRDYISMNTIYRAQWVSLEGAPESFAFAIDMPLNYTKLGLGISGYSDSSGPVDDSRLVLDFSYTLRTGGQTRISLGLKTGLGLFNTDYSVLNIFDETDQNFSQDITNQVSPLVGIGTYVYGKSWYLGVSVPNLLTNSFSDGNLVSFVDRRQHLFFISGYIFDITRNLQVKPSLLLNYINGAPISADIATNFLIQNKVTLGASYRWSSSINALFGFQFNKNFFLGYAYDTGLNELSNYSNGSHEIFIRYDIYRKNKRIRSPRFF